MIVETENIRLLEMVKALGIVHPQNVVFEAQQVS